MGSGRADLGAGGQGRGGGALLEFYSAALSRFLLCRCLSRRPPPPALLECYSAALSRFLLCRCLSRRRPPPPALLECYSSALSRCVLCRCLSRRRPPPPPAVAARRPPLLLAAAARRRPPLPAARRRRPPPPPTGRRCCPQPPPALGVVFWRNLERPRPCSPGGMRGTGVQRNDLWGSWRPWWKLFEPKCRRSRRSCPRALCSVRPRACVYTVILRLTEIVPTLPDCL